MPGLWGLGVLSYLGYAWTCWLWFCGLSTGCTIFLASVLINRVKTCPKQDMVLQELRRGDLQFDIFIFIEKGMFNFIVLGLSFIISELFVLVTTLPQLTV